MLNLFLKTKLIGNNKKLLQSICANFGGGSQKHLKNILNQKETWEGAEKNKHQTSYNRRKYQFNIGNNLCVVSSFKRLWKSIVAFDGKLQWQRL